MGEPRHKRRRTTASAAPLSCIDVGKAEAIIEGTDDATSEDESCAASLLETAFSACLRVDSFDRGRVEGFQGT